MELDGLVWRIVALWCCVHTPSVAPAQALVKYFSLQSRFAFTPNPAYPVHRLDLTTRFYLNRAQPVAHDLPVMLNRFITFGLPIISGIVLALTFPTWHLHYAMWGALVPLFFAARRSSTPLSAAQFYLAGLLFHLVLLQWLMSNIYWAGGFAIIGYFILCAILSVYWGILGWFVARMRDALPPAIFPFALATVWFGMEFVQSFLFTGFGWGALGYAQATNLWVAQWASLGGVSLVSFIVVLTNAFITRAVEPGSLQHRSSNAMGAVVVLVLAHLIGGALMRPADYESRPFRTGVFQADFPLEMKHDPEYWRHMRESAATKSIELLQDGQVDLFVWPEALVMEDSESPDVVAHLKTFTDSTGSALFAGASRSDKGTGGERNSSIMLSDTSEVLGYYDKIHLAPFGEYVPFGKFLPFIEQVVPIGGVEAGAEPKIFKVKDRTLGPLICFEVLFGHMPETLRRRGADVLAVVTNLGWFGRSNAIPQELEIARMRAIETRLPLIHAANTGISGVFDPYGRLTYLNGAYDGSGRWFRMDWPEMVKRGYTQQSLIGERMGGNLPVPAPGVRLIPAGPIVLPWLALLACIGLLIWTFWPRVPHDDNESDETPEPKPTPRTRKPAAPTEKPVQTELPIPGRAPAPKPRRKRKPKSS